ncbi:glycoside hydrolase superfamily [Aspergillus granulosus]|uniref:beta-glucosidase n=1 Tax=Aspergillus granulosus TaxID=176169 RepID=A0ABR4H1X1_9EURO
MRRLQDKKKTIFPYWNAALSVDERVEDLLQRMTVAEKSGLLFQDMITMGTGGALAPASPTRWYNNLQRMARKTRLGIPITLSTDPRNHFTDNIGTGIEAGIFSHWPESLGFAVLRSATLVEKFADIACQEYLAIGLRLALHSQVDLATEPYWSRIGAAFGEDADLTSDLVAAYIKGFQRGPNIGPEPKDGEDRHFAYGQEQVYSGNNMEYHLKPFRAAVKAGATQIMPYYGMPEIITGLLGEQIGFQGVVCTDWGLLTDKQFFGEPMPARAWGMEHLLPEERLQVILEAGCDQLRGESCPELLTALTNNGLLPLERLDRSVRRLLREKPFLGLFESPFVDEDVAEQVVGKPEFASLGADVSHMRLKAPYTPRPGRFESLFHAGSFQCTAEEKLRQKKIFARVPVGKLPFDLPSSIEAVQQLKSDMPYDTKDPPSGFSHGLSYYG